VPFIQRFRKHQREAIDFALESFRSGKQVVLFEGPTGFGKSIANVVIAESFGSAYYTSAQVALVDQLRSDPLLRDGIAGVYGKSNYSCAVPHWSSMTVDKAPCERGLKCGSCDGKGQVYQGGGPVVCDDCKGRGSQPYDCKLRLAEGDGPDIEGPPKCPYYLDKFHAAHRRVAVMTMAYLLLASTSETGPRGRWGLVRGQFPPRELLIVDEAHGTAGFAADHISLTLSQKRLYTDVWRETWGKIRHRALAVREEADAIAFIRDVLMPSLETNRKVLEDMTWGGGIAGEKAQRALTDLESFELSVDLALEDLTEGNPWAIDPREEEDKLVLQPVLVGPFLRRRLWNRANHYLLSTATVLDPDLTLRELGLEDMPYAYLKVPSTFPPERSPVIDATVGPLTRRYKKIVMPRALEQLCHILDIEKGRGIVHCHSYENAAYIRDNVNDGYRPRLVFHESVDRGDVLEAWLHDGRHDSVLVSVAMTEGLDLRDDLARFAVIWKVPYPSLGDKRVSRRLKLEDGERWYRIVTLRTIIQAAGRIVRSEEDEGRIYVLDSSFHTLLSQTSKWVPEWFKERIQVGRSFDSGS